MRIIHSLIAHLLVKRARAKRRILLAAIKRSEKEISLIERDARRHHLLAVCQFRQAKSEPAPQLVALPAPRPSFRQFNFKRKAA